jgi:hypothetical protein
MREKFPAIYFQCVVKLAQVHRVELGQPMEFDRPCSREEALQRLERSAGPGREKCSRKFLAQVDKLEADQAGLA